MATVDEILARQAYAEGDETWTKDNNYPSYTLYVEPEYVPVTNKRIADFNDQISVRGEQNAQFVGFQLPRYDDGLDLTAQHLYIHYQTAYPATCPGRTITSRCAGGYRHRPHRSQGQSR